MKEIYKEFKGDDMEFYEQILVKYSLEERLEFIKNTPDFLQDYPVNPIRDDRLYLLDDEIYRKIIQKIKDENC